MDILIGVAHIGHIPYNEALSSLRIIDGAVLTYLKQIGYVAPDLKENKKQPYPGAYVKPPQKGRHEWVYDLDFASLYPSIIRTLNMSNETKLEKIDN
jgi:DNA polymerase elongation subunit (family B)